MYWRLSPETNAKHASVSSWETSLEQLYNRLRQKKVEGPSKKFNVLSRKEVTGIFIRRCGRVAAVFLQPLFKADMGRITTIQCSVIFWYGSGSWDPYLWLTDPDPVPDPWPYRCYLHQKEAERVVFWELNRRWLTSKEEKPTSKWAWYMLESLRASLGMETATKTMRRQEVRYSSSVSPCN